MDEPNLKIRKRKSGLYTPPCRTKISFVADADVAAVLKLLSKDALPLPDGTKPTVHQIANAIISQSAKQISGLMLWLNPGSPGEYARNVVRVAGYKLVEPEVDLSVHPLKTVATLQGSDLIVFNNYLARSYRA